MCNKKDDPKSLLEQYYNYLESPQADMDIDLDGRYRTFNEWLELRKLLLMVQNQN
jgi:hypothetical protein